VTELADHPNRLLVHHALAVDIAAARAEAGHGHVVDFSQCRLRRVGAGVEVRRREFIRTLGGAALWPLAARAQQSEMPVIGFLHAGSAAERTHAVASLQKGLGEADYVENRNVAFELRWADGQFEARSR
jgi:hypothetical protein